MESAREELLAAKADLDAIRSELPYRQVDPADDDRLQEAFEKARRRFMRAVERWTNAEG